METVTLSEARQDLKTSHQRGQGGGKNSEDKSVPLLSTETKESKEWGFDGGVVIRKERECRRQGQG